jgi:hypothetical protein
MRVASNNTDAMRGNMTRRKVVFGTGTLCAGAIGTVALSSNNTTAQVDGGLSVSDGSATLVDEQLQDVTLDVTATWSYEANVDISSVECELHTGQKASSLALIDRQVTDTSAQSDDGQTDLSGSILQAPDFQLEDMRPGTGEKSITALAEVRVFAISDGQTQAKTTIQDTFTMTLSQEEVTVTLSSGGNGGVSFVTD